MLRGKESRVILNSDQIAPIMKQAIVAIEDKRFYEHRGVDLRAIGRALAADIENKAVVQGGSTITQQFIKNAYVEDQRSVARKLKEAALAWQLEQRKPKDWILTAYLNTIYFGNGAYGIGQAALTYFQKPASAAHAAGGRTPGRHPARPGAVRSRDEPEGREGAAPHRPRPDAPAGNHRPRPAQRGPQRRSARAGRGPAVRARRSGRASTSSTTSSSS